MTFSPEELQILSRDDAALDARPVIVRGHRDRREYFRIYMRLRRLAERSAEGRMRYERIPSPPKELP